MRDGTPRAMAINLDELEPLQDKAFRSYYTRGSRGKSAPDYPPHFDRHICLSSPLTLIPHVYGVSKACDVTILLDQVRTFMGLSWGWLRRLFAASRLAKLTLTACSRTSCVEGNPMVIHSSVNSVLYLQHSAKMHQLSININ